MFDFGLAATGLAIAAATYAATNVDGLVLLVGWLMSDRYPASKVFAGYAVGMGLVLIASLAAGLAGNKIPAEYVGYLGAVPILLGLKMLYDQLRGPGSDSAGHTAPAGTAVVVVTIATAQLSNGVDSVLVFAPLLADSRMSVDLSIAAGYLLMVPLWFALARYATTHAKRFAAIRSVGLWLGPLIMIAVGLYIIDNTATDLVEGY